MIFFYNGKEYSGTTAVEIVREMERDAQGRPHRGGTVRDFLSRSLSGLADRIHARELDIGAHLSDETLAFSYLCLLDEYDVGRLQVSPPDPQTADQR